MEAIVGDSVWDDRAPHRPPRPPVQEPPPLPRELRLWPVPTTAPVLNRIYSYWSNAWINGDTAHVFIGHEDGVHLYAVNLVTGEVHLNRSRVLLPAGTGEGWYWDKGGRISLCDGPRLRRLSPYGELDETLIDISETHPGCRLWQAHSSDDGLVHSATVERIVSDGPYERIGTIIKRAGGVDYFPAQATLDESQVARGGRWLLIKEGDDNRIVDLTGVVAERVMTDADGALGHSDCGPDFAVGEDNQRGACIWLDLATLDRRVLFETWNMGYVSVRGGKCLHSGETHLNLVDLNGGGVTPLVEHGGGSSYDERVKANLDPTGRVGFYVSRGVAWVLELP